jgi:hypothetical protein
MAGLLFLGFVLRIGANRLTQGFRLFAIRVNAVAALSLFIPRAPRRRGPFDQLSE